MQDKILIEKLKATIQSFQSKCDEYKKILREKEAANNYKLISRVLEFFETLQDTVIFKNPDLFLKYQSDIIDFIELSNTIINDSYTRRSLQTRESLISFAKTLTNGLIKELQNPPKDPLAEVKDERKLDDYEKKLKDLQNSFDAYKESAQIIIEDLKKIRDEETTNVNNTLKKVKDIELSAINAKAAFNEEHTLHEARIYWQDKKKKHSRNALGIFLLFLAVVIILGYEAIKQSDIETTNIIMSAPTKVQMYPIDSNTTLSSNKQNTSLQAIQIIHYIKFLFLVSLAIWVSRILLKLTFSNLHLSEEAHEKETMILTYLALIKEGGGLEENDRKLVLEAIFRPSTNGLIKDETNVTLLDLINAFKK